MTNIKSSTKYENDVLAMPAAHIVYTRLFPWLRPFLGKLFRLRSIMSQPFQIRVIPKWIPLPKSKCYQQYDILQIPFFITYGEIILIVPLAILFVVGYINSFLDPQINLSGHLAAVALIITFLTANKSSSIIAFVLDIPFERLIFYHNVSSVLALVLSFFHTYVTYVHPKEDSDDESDDRSRLIRALLSTEDDEITYNNDRDISNENLTLIKFCFQDGTNTTGSLLILCMIGLITTSFFPVIRRWFFEPWLFTHILCTAGVVGFAIAHGAITILIVGIWWIIDLGFRYVVMAHYLYPKKATLELVLPDVVQVRFPKTFDFNYNAGQFVQVCFPSIAPMQFHPITISSAPQEEIVTLHIRSLGNWSKQLASSVVAANAKTKGTLEEIDIMLEGPYGSSAIDLNNDDKYQMILCVGGGIGVTPCQSIARSILYQHQNDERKLCNLQFVWAVQSLEMAVAIPPPPVIDCATVVEGSELLANTKGNANVLSTHVYITKPSGTSESDDLAASSSSVPFAVFEGRPNFHSIFQHLREEAKQHKLTNVAVICCGPKQMMIQVRECCRKYSDAQIAHGDERVIFDLHEEHFEF